MRVELNKAGRELIKEIRELGRKYGIPIAIDGLKMEASSSISEQQDIDILFYVSVKVYLNRKYLAIEL